MKNDDLTIDHKTLDFEIRLFRLDSNFIKQGVNGNVDVDQLINSDEFKSKRQFDYKKFLIYSEDDKQPLVAHQCPSCPFTSNDKRSVVIHSGRHRQLPKYRLKYKIIYCCALCDSSTDSSDEIKQHYRTHFDQFRTELQASIGYSNGEQFKCTICHTTFQTELSITSHLFLRHALYGCTFCEVKAPDFDSLER